MPNDHGVYYNLGNTLHELGNLDEAESNLKQAISNRDPELAIFCNQYALFHVKLAPNRFVLPNSQNTPNRFT